jgi:membrane protein
MTAILFGIGKWALGLYLGTGTAGSTYGAASSLITLLLWVYYSSQILLFGSEFTQVYADRAHRSIEPADYAVRIETKEVGHQRRLQLSKLAYGNAFVVVAFSQYDDSPSEL